MRVANKVCEFDISLRPDRESFARRAIAYLEKKIPQLYAELGMLMFDASMPMWVTFADIGNGEFQPPRTIRLPLHHGDNDLGCLLHESVHRTQQPGYDSLYAEFRILYEGVADYYRIVLSDDQMGDFGHTGRETLSEQFTSGDPYDSGSEFVAFLRRRSAKGAFVRELNEVLRRGNAGELMSLILRRCGRDVTTLLREYGAERATILGNNPREIKRFSGSPQ